MTMGEGEHILSSLAMPILVGPSLANLEKQDPSAAQMLRVAFNNAEAAHPGLCHSFILGLIKKADMKVNMNESLLRVQGAALEQDSSDFRINRSEEAFQVYPVLIFKNLTNLVLIVPIKIGALQEICRLEEDP